MLREIDLSTRTARWWARRRQCARRAPRLQRRRARPQAVHAQRAHQVAQRIKVELVGARGYHKRKVAGTGGGPRVRRQLWGQQRKQRRFYVFVAAVSAALPGCKGGEQPPGSAGRPRACRCAVAVITACFRVEAGWKSRVLMQQS